MAFASWPTRLVEVSRKVQMLVKEEFQVRTPCQLCNQTGKVMCDCGDHRCPGDAPCTCKYMDGVYFQIRWKKIK